MEMMDNYALFSILAVGLGLLARYFLAGLWNATQPFCRLGMIAGLFLVYTAGLSLLLHRVYRYVSATGGSVQSYHHLAILALLMANTIVCFVGIFYYMIRGKRKLSGEDKMKLMDL
ncbi:MAG: hypothetical protein K2P30_16815 [Lachnospiraceae bacterium]|nr:hypothetical protein [Lachnospiraceae bacterium]MDE6965279.1 hypothetical protein [Lachnospiraceae bacterium]